MNTFGSIMLIGWIPLAVLLFAAMPARRAVIVAALFAWLFLPMGGFTFAGLPDYNKATATPYGIMLGVCLFDARRLLAFRAAWVDLPMLVWCLCPFATSLSNGLGVHDAGSATLRQVVMWGLPFFIGRLYFSNVAALRELAIGVILGGLVYALLCIVELLISPQLHRLAYGFHAHAFSQHVRFWGYRPMVFMQHALAVGMWMAATSLVAGWMYISGAQKQLYNIPMLAIAVLLAVVTVLTKAFGASALLFGGILTLVGTKVWRSPLPIIIVALIPLLYVTVRSTDTWSGRHLVNAIAHVAANRSQSLEHRLDAENLLVDRALERPVLGWGDWNRNRVFDERGKDLAVTDGLWIITLGKRGLLGLSALMAVFIVPALCLVRCVPGWAIGGPSWAPAVSLMMVILLFQIDSLFNAMFNPIYIIMIGGLTGVAAILTRMAPAERIIQLARSAS